MLKNKEQIPFWLLTIGAIIALILPQLLKDGMYSEGVISAAVAHNLAIDKGSFWFPYFDNVVYPLYHRQPPLSFALQAIFFDFLGDGMYTERIYSFTTACIAAILMAFFWRRIFKENESMRKLSWLPVLLWITIPVCSWSYSSNLPVNTAVIFILGSVFLIYEGLTKEKLGFLFFIPAGLCMSLSFLCNGTLGFFPIALPVIYWAVVKRKVYSPIRTAIQIIIIGATTGLVFFVLLINNHISQSISAYMMNRGIFGENAVMVGNRFTIIIHLFFLELSIPIIITTLLLLFYGPLAFWKNEENDEVLTTALVFALVGACLSFPLITSKEQQNYYLMPSFPYYAIALACIAGPGIIKLQERINSGVIRTITLISIVFVLTAALFSYLQTGKIRQDGDILKEVYVIGRIIPPDTVVRVYPETYNESRLHNYFARYFNISLAADTSSQYRYFIDEKSLHRRPPVWYHTLIQHGSLYDLYKKDE